MNFTHQQSNKQNPRDNIEDRNISIGGTDRVIIRKEKPSNNRPNRSYNKPENRSAQVAHDTRIDTGPNHLITITPASSLLSYTSRRIGDTFEDSSLGSDIDGNENIKLTHFPSAENVKQEQKRPRTRMEKQKHNDEVGSKVLLTESELKAVRKNLAADEIRKHMEETSSSVYFRHKLQRIKKGLEQKRNTNQVQQSWKRNRDRTQTEWNRQLAEIDKRLHAETKRFTAEINILAQQDEQCGCSQERISDCCRCHYHCDPSYRHMSKHCNLASALRKIDFSEEIRALGAIKQSSYESDRLLFEALGTESKSGSPHKGKCRLSLEDEDRLLAKLAKEINLTTSKQTSIKKILTNLENSLQNK